MKMRTWGEVADAAVALFAVAMLLTFVSRSAAAGDHKPPLKDEPVKVEIEIDNYVHPTAIGEAYSTSRSDAEAEADARSDSSSYSRGGDAEATGGDGGEASAEQSQDQSQTATSSNDGNRQSTEVSFNEAPSSAAPVFAGMCNSGASYQDKKFGFSVGTSNDVCVLLHAADALYAGEHKAEAIALVCQAGRLARVKGYMGMARAIMTLGIL